MKFLRVLLSILLSSQLLGCGVSNSTQPTLSESERLFLNRYPEHEQIEDLELQVARINYDLGRPVSISLYIMNFSKETVFFPSGFTFDILVYDEKINEWRKIEDQAFRVATGDIVYPPLSKDDGYLGFRASAIAPKLDNEELPITIRVVLNGQTYKNNPTDKKVFTYLDIELANEINLSE